MALLTTSIGRGDSGDDPPVKSWGRTTVVTADRDGRLKYVLDANKNRVPDFSHCGYAGADQPIPRVPVRATVEPTGTDDGRRIQAAIDYVSNLPLGPDGFRGAVLLAPGDFRIGGQLQITHSGIVLRGRGATEGGTRLRAVGVERRALVRMHGTCQITLAESKQVVVDAYVPVGASEFRLDSSEGLSVGDSVLIVRPSTKAWIRHLGADATGVGWRAGSRDLRWERVITDIHDNTIRIDAPITTAIEQRFGGATVRRLAWPGRIENVGIEDLALVSEFDRPHKLDEEHAWLGVTMQNVKDAWVRRLTFRHFAGGAVWLWENASRVSVQDCLSFEPVSEVGGYRRHSFFTQGQLCLFLRCWAEQGRRDFSVGHCAPGPNAFVHCQAHRTLGDSGPIASWASGVLYDNVRIDGGELRLHNRDQSPDGAGWSAANCMLWQCQAAKVRCFSPPGASNWAVGTWATTAGDGVIQDSNSFVRPLSLYQAQLRQRLGANAAKRVDPLLLDPVSATNPTVDAAARFASRSTQPPRRLINVIRRNQQTGSQHNQDPERLTTEGPSKSDSHDFQGTQSPGNDRQQLHLKNGWLTVDDRLKTGGHLTPVWWRGTLRPAEAPEFGPAITRFVPGRVGVGFTDELDQVARSMLRNKVASYDHHYGLWYDRRRDDHLMVRRADGDVMPPFYEQPFARSGNGTAWDGLSRYDLTKFNPWYWNRLRRFAERCDQYGLVLFQQHYFQHNVLEAGAHWADCPWRPANNVNDTGLPEPPQYIGGKRIFLARMFYDASDSRRRKLHRTYIRQCLDSFIGCTNVIHSISAEYTGPLSFTRFWLDTIIEWQQETGHDVLISLSCTKDVQDAILTDPRRSEHIDVIDIRYWTYAANGRLYAPEGGRNLSPRQHLRQQKPAATSFSSIVRAVREYRDRYPAKAITYYADLHCRSDRDGWAVLMGGGSLPKLPDVDPALAASIPEMRPSDTLELGANQWCLSRSTDEYLVYSTQRDAETMFTVPRGGSDFRVREIDPASGRVIVERNIAAGQMITIPRRAVILWLRR